jgi:hypothetical protein
MCCRSGSRSGFRSPDLAEVVSKFIDNKPVHQCVVFAKLEYLMAKTLVCAVLVDAEK